MSDQEQTTHGSDESANKTQFDASEIVTDKLTPKQKKVAEQITQWIALGGIALVNVDPYDAMLMLRTSGRHAELIVRAARHDKRVWDVLERLTQSSDFVALASFEGLLLYAILAHHGRLPKNDTLLQQFGYSEAQILEVPEGMNGNAAPTGAAL